MILVSLNKCRSILVFKIAGFKLVAKALMMVLVVPSGSGGVRVFENSRVTL